MSTLKVGGIRGVSASSDAITVANDGTCTANITNNLSNRNLIINGAMQVAQRATSSTSSGYQTVDRFRTNFNGLDNNPTMAQVDVASGTTPYTQGFRKAFKVTNGDQTGGAGASDQFSVSYLVEDQDLATSGWNYLSATSYITLSFWFKSSVNQSFYVVIESKDGSSKQYSFIMTPTGADTWTKVTHTIPGNSGLQFSNDNGEGIEIYFLLFYGTGQTTSGHTLNTWKATSASDQAPDMTSTWYTTNNATWEMTGVQLEVSDHATDFEHKSFGQELLRCQRYFVVVRQSTGMCGDSNGSSQVRELNIPIPVAMRATPTVASGITYHMWHGDNGGKNNDGTAMTISSYNNETCLVGVLNGFSGNTDNRTVVAVPNTGAMKISAEL
jgi:hypothetical protein